MNCGENNSNRRPIAVAISMTYEDCFKPKSNLRSTVQMSSIQQQHKTAQFSYMY